MGIELGRHKLEANSAINNIRTDQNNKRIGNSQITRPTWTCTPAANYSKTPSYNWSSLLFPQT
jgi:hypothetical protein